MDEERRKGAFISLLERLQSSGRITEQDRQMLRSRRLSVIPEERHEAPIPPGPHVPRNIDEFLRFGYHTEEGEQIPLPRYRTAEEGLRKHGWAEMPFEIKVLGEGAYGSVRLVFWQHDLNKAMEKRRLSALKAQQFTSIGRSSNWLALWREVTILRACVHPHIIDIYAHFIITPDGGETDERERERKHMPSARATTKVKGVTDPKTTFVKRLAPADSSDKFSHYERPEKKYPHKIKVANDQLWILMEYANAGNMRTEIARYPGHEIPEHGARYYGLQVLDALKYLHARDIRHNDLHSGNVVLSYNSDGETKTCKICDFGLAVIGYHNDPPARRSFNSPFFSDVCRAATLILTMLSHDGEVTRLSRLAKIMMNTMTPDSVEQLLQFEWFKQPAYPPIPGDLVHADDPDDQSAVLLSFPQPKPLRITDVREAADTPGPSSRLPQRQQAVRYEHLQHQYSYRPSEVRSYHPTIYEVFKENERRLKEIRPIRFQPPPRTRTPSPVAPAPAVEVSPIHIYDTYVPPQAAARPSLAGRIRQGISRGAASLRNVFRRRQASERRGSGRVTFSPLKDSPPEGGEEEATGARARAPSTKSVHFEDFS